MTRRNAAHKLLAVAFALGCSLVLVGADLGTLAQNTNSSTTADSSMQNTNSDVRPRGEGTPGTEHAMSGTYTGTINAPDMNMSGPATITFSANTFTIDAGGSTQSGTYTAREWPGQIAMSLRFGTETPANIVSARMKHWGSGGLSIMSVPGESKKFSFTTGGSMGGGRRRRRGRRSAAPPPAAEAPPATEATPPPPAN